MGETVSGTLVGMIDVGTSTSGIAATLLLDDGTTITGNGAGTLTIGAGSTLDIENGTTTGVPDATLDGVLVSETVSGTLVGMIDVGTSTSGVAATLRWMTARRSPAMERAR